MIAVLVTPGEALDRLSILYIKEAHAKPEVAAGLREDIEALKKSISGHFDFADLEGAFANMLAINRRLWALEDEMHGQPLDYERAGKIGLAIAAQNGERSAEKRRLDTLLGVRPEYKLYGAKST